MRYDWQLTNATRSGYAPFLIFHGALAMVVTSAFACNWKLSKVRKPTLPSYSDVRGDGPTGVVVKRTSAEAGAVERIETARVDSAIARSIQ